MASELSKPRIVCAATRHGDLIVPSPRHRDATYRAIRLCVKNALYAAGEQGFIDQHGRFYTRLEAWHIAETNGQIVRRVGGDGADHFGLFSENLY